MRVPLLTTAFLAALVVLPCDAAPAPFRREPALPSPWTRHERLPPFAAIALRFALRERGMDALKEKARDVSSSPKR